MHGQSSYSSHQVPSHSFNLLLASVMRSKEHNNRLSVQSLRSWKNVPFVSMDHLKEAPTSTFPVLIWDGQCGGGGQGPTGSQNYQLAPGNSDYHFYCPPEVVSGSADQRISLIMYQYKIISGFMCIIFTFHWILWYWLNMYRVGTEKKCECRH